MGFAFCASPLPVGRRLTSHASPPPRETHPLLPFRLGDISNIQGVREDALRRRIQLGHLARPSDSIAHRESGLANSGALQVPLQLAKSLVKQALSEWLTRPLRRKRRRRSGKPAPNSSGQYPHTPPMRQGENRSSTSASRLSPGAQPKGCALAPMPRRLG